MKNYLIILSLALAVASCGSNKADQPAEDGSDTLAAVYSWEASLNDSTGKLEITKDELGGPDTLTAASVITYLNARNPNVQLTFVKISGDTLYVSIPDAHYLTQQMGSSGPQLYFAETVYNLTELAGIKHVNFDLEEGDHAGPETLNRDSFKGD